MSSIPNRTEILKDVPNARVPGFVAIYQADPHYISHTLSHPTSPDLTTITVLLKG